MSAATQAKAERLLAEGRVEPLPLTVRLYRVTGDTGIHLVTMTAAYRSCDCEHGKKGERDCSHILAAIAYFNAELNYDEGGSSRLPELEAALSARKKRDAALAEDAFRRLG
jgi:hypothetical protein